MTPTSPRLPPPPPPPPIFAATKQTVFRDLVYETTVEVEAVGTDRLRFTIVGMFLFFDSPFLSPFSLLSLLSLLSTLSSRPLTPQLNTWAWSPSPSPSSPKK